MVGIYEVCTGVWGNAVKNLPTQNLEVVATGDPVPPAMSWWERRLAHNTLYSLATGALAVAFGAANLIGLILDSTTLVTAVASAAGALFSAVVFLLVLRKGRKLHLSVGFILVLVHLAIGVLNVWIGLNRHNVFLSLQEVPIFALFIAGFYRPFIARAFTAFMLAAMGGAMLFGDLGGSWTSASVGPANMLSTIIFATICCEAGVVIQAWFDEKTSVDSLTGALNRAGFMEAARAEVRRAERTGTPTSMALIDIDAFKSVNDTRGHHAGDVLLQELVAQWTTLTRSNDLVGRLGGDEFILLFPNTPATTAEVVVKRLRARSSHPWSWGITEVRGDEAFTDVVQRADEAMYRSRQAS